MINALLLVVALLAALNLITIKAWETQSKDAIDLMNEALEIIKKYEKLLKEVKND